MRERAKTAGIGATLIAAMLGVAPSSVYRWLDRGGRQALTVVAAWEIMTPAQRRAWLAALEVMPRRRRGRPSSGAAR